MRTLLLLALVSPALAQERVRFGADRDNTLYESKDGSVSNAVGELLFAGSTGIGAARAAVLHFDVSSIPAGARVTSVELRLVVSQLSPHAKEGTLAIHRLLDDWGEGSSHAVVEPGKGAPASDGDATWLHRFWPTEFWQQAGGDYQAPHSAESPTGLGTGPILWSGQGLTADVQAWVDGTQPNHGWLIRALGILPKWTARGFDSRESVTIKKRPRLVVEYLLGCESRVECESGSSGTIRLATCDCAAGTAELVLSGAQPGVFALLLTGQGAGALGLPGVAGDLCLGGSTIGRFILDIGPTDANGSFRVDVLDALTDGGGGKVPAIGGYFCLPIGSTWRFQYLHGSFGGELSPLLEVTFH
ncbi:MAG: DNRLRE domain-containing protein [Planctomycetota bacterium]|nr:DNRLRE domain-containing protein [Planctomycetota bacterium]